MKIRTVAALVAGILSALVIPAASRAGDIDDVDTLVRKLQPPRRFAEHKPRWHVEEKTYTFRDVKMVDGNETEYDVDVPHYLVMDGDRVVAIVPRALFHCGVIFALDFRPGQAPTRKQLDELMPTERWHIETTVGTQLRTDAFIPSSQGSKDSTFDWKVDGSRLILTRRYKGRTAFNKWTHRTRGKEVNVDVTNTVTIRVDPQLGYVFDATYDAWTDEKLRRFEYASAATTGRHSPWPDEISCYRIAISSGDGDGFHGYATNYGCTRQHVGGGKCRDRGMVAFLNDKTGWTPAFTQISGATSTLVVCRPHTDHDFTLPAEKIRRESRDGMDHYVVRHRMLALPPEVTRHVWKNMKLLHADEKAVMLRMGQTDDFEDQPLSLGGRQRGMMIGGEITEGQAHSGKRSLRWSGNTSLTGLTLCVRPSRTYRLEAWLKVRDLTDAEKQALRQERQQKIERARKSAQRAKERGKKPRPLPQFEAIGDAQAWITLQFQQWDGSPKFGKLRKTEVVKARDGWTRVAIEFDAPAWGPSLDVDFIARDGVAWMDDFSLKVVESGADRE